MKRLLSVLVSSLYAVALALLVVFAYSFGLRWALLAGGLAVFVIALALDGDS